MQEILDMIELVLDEGFYGTMLLNDIWSCFPSVLQTFIFTLFVLVFGVAVISFIVRILR